MLGIFLSGKHMSEQGFIWFLGVHSCEMLGTFPSCTKCDNSVVCLGPVLETFASPLHRHLQGHYGQACCFDFLVAGCHYGLWMLWDCVWHDGWCQGLEGKTMRSCCIATELYFVLNCCGPKHNTCCTQFFKCHLVFTGNCSKPIWGNPSVATTCDGDKDWTAGNCHEKYGNRWCPHPQFRKSLLFGTHNAIRGHSSDFCWIVYCWSVFLSSFTVHYPLFQLIHFSWPPCLSIPTVFPMGRSSYGTVK